MIQVFIWEKVSAHTTYIETRPFDDLATAEAWAKEHKGPTQNAVVAEDDEIMLVWKLIGANRKEE